ncbi:MAG: hypothetical protein ABSF15_17910, partial [Candidatus Sulfotelmatobacter sp.]
IHLRNTTQKWNANLLWKDGRSENESNQALISVAKSALRNRCAIGAIAGDFRPGTTHQARSSVPGIA